MRFNPFEEKPMPLDQLFMDWDKLYPKPYHLGTVHPYTKVRIVLMNGTEFEAQWFGHQFSRHCQDNDLRRTGYDPPHRADAAKTNQLSEA